VLPVSVGCVSGICVGMVGWPRGPDAGVGENIKCFFLNPYQYINVIVSSDFFSLPKEVRNFVRT